MGVGTGFELAALILLGLSAFTWFGVLLGLLVRNSDAMQGAAFAIVFPLAFLADTFVPIQGMKTAPRIIGEWDSLSAFVAAIRHPPSARCARAQRATVRDNWNIPCRR